MEDEMDFAFGFFYEVASPPSSPEYSYDSEDEQGTFGELRDLICEGDTQAVINYMEKYNMTPEYYRRQLERGGGDTRDGTYLPLPVGETAEVGRLEIMNAIIAKGFDPNAQDSRSTDDLQRRPIHWACVGGHLDIVKCLVEDHGVDVDSRDGDDNTPLYYAFEEKHTDIVKYLIESGASVHDHTGVLSTTALHESVANCDQDVVQYILSKGVDVNAKSSDKSTPLFYAAMYSTRTENAYLLLSAGANIEDKDDEGRTPFLSAAEVSDLDFMKLLVSKGADPNVIDNHGNSALHYAMSYDVKISTLEYLVVELGLESLNSINSKGETLFSLAIEKASDKSVFQLLINYGCSITGEIPMLDEWKLNRFIKHIPDGKEFLEHLKQLASQPRTLQDIACVKLRRMLGARIDSAVKELPLPDILKDLVRPQSIDDIVNVCLKLGTP